MRLLIALLLASTLGGCSKDAGEYSLDGSFTPERTEADFADFHATVTPHSDNVLIRESFPEQFSILGLDESCEGLRVTLDAKPYIAVVGACQS